MCIRDSKRGEFQIADLRNTVDAFQGDYIRQALEHFNGNKSLAAKALGIDKSNFHRLIKRLNIH